MSVAARLSAAAVVALLPLAAAAPAAGADGPPPGKHLILMSQSVMDSSKASFEYLTCDPIGGTHPKAESACVDLTEAGGDFDALPEEQGICTMEYAPVKLSAFGHWDGRLVHYRSGEHPNSCVANLKTGGDVFDFPRPAPRG